jgi:single-strand DNA-binding protein
LAVNRRWQNRQTQEWEEATSFFDIVCWQSLAENVSESLHRGARIIVTGRLDQRSWETSEGEKRSKVEVTADDIGPSLRWASAEIKKNERKSPGDPSAGGRPAASPPAASTPEAAAPYANYDEEPF